MPRLFPTIDRRTSKTYATEERAQAAAEAVCAQTDPTLRYVLLAAQGRIAICFILQGDQLLNAAYLANKGFYVTV